MKTSQKGFIGIIAIVIIALAVGAGATYYAMDSKDNNKDNNATIVNSETDTGTSYIRPSTSSQPQKIEVKEAVTHTSVMGFTIKAPSGWLATDEMAGHYTIAQTEATGWKQGSNLEISIVRTNKIPKLEPGFTYCGEDLMRVRIDVQSTDLVRTCKGTTMHAIVWHNGYLFVGKSIQENGNHDEDVKIFADVVSSFSLKK